MISVLCVREDSVYKLMDVDTWDKERDALLFNGTNTVIAHPPCRAWGRFRWRASPDPGEKALAVHAAHMVRRNGGVLEHPASSTLWSAVKMPTPGTRDIFGGWTLPIVQHDFGHPCRKATWLYICGVEPQNVPPLPLTLGSAEFAIGTRREPPEGWREKTPPELAEWLVNLAKRVDNAGRDHVFT